MSTNNLITNNEFELFYLIELTKQKIKPLSRWEKPLSEQTREYIRKQGLYLDVISRKTFLRYTIYETIFSTSSHYLDFYRHKFNHSLLRKDNHTKQLEGFLFGYPSCCTNQFIKKPYISNELSKADQSILFHWACKNCRVTPELIPYYKPIYNRITEWYRNETFANKQPKEIYVNNYRRKLQTAIATLLVSTGLLSAQTSADTLHFIPLPNDTNNSGLSYTEEIYLGTYEHSLLDDCQYYAKFFKAMVDTLPTSIQTNRAYKLEHFLKGLVQCPKCGININMGYVTIVNPLRNLQIDIPFLGLHFMENGYFSYGNDEDYQRVDIDTLKKILYPHDPEHMLTVNDDSDGDGLTDAEEDSLWLEYTIDNKDYDSDGVPDGAQIAEEIVRLFPKLKEKANNIHSHINFIPARGSENCQICGSHHNMGYIEITNPENNRSYQMPYISLHALAHGSFAFDGTVHQNQRINAVELYRVMKTHMLFITEDSDNDGLKDNEEEYFDFNPNSTDSNNDGVCDGMELALSFVDSIKSLPTEPSMSEPYIEHLAMDGIQLCSVCGSEIPMGLMKIYNPQISTTIPLEITYYAFHFMEKGSFAYEGAEEGRINPIELSDYLNITLVDIRPELTNNTPTHFILEQNYPNPFNPVTEINFWIKKDCDVTIDVHNLQGQLIKNLIHKYYIPGHYKIKWDGTNESGIEVPSGLYFYRMKTNYGSFVKRMLFIK